MQFSSLEPDERCHLVFVKDVQISCSLSPAALPSPGMQHRECSLATLCAVLPADPEAHMHGLLYSGDGSKPCTAQFSVRYHNTVRHHVSRSACCAGHRELPTCPVCLERLDENASGIVTTVSTCCISMLPYSVMSWQYHHFMISNLILRSMAAEGSDNSRYTCTGQSGFICSMRVCLTHTLLCNTAMQIHMLPNEVCCMSS